MCDGFTVVFNRAQMSCVRRRRTLGRPRTESRTNTSVWELIERTFLRSLLKPLMNVKIPYVVGYFAVALDLDLERRRGGF